MKPFKPTNEEIEAQYEFAEALTAKPEREEWDKMIHGQTTYDAYLEWCGANGVEPKPYPHTRPERHTWIVAVYLADLGYGGPEEGGWWYDRGELARIARVFPNEDRAYQYCRRLNHKLESKTFGPNQGKREKSSVLSDGCYEASVHQDIAPKVFPAVRPHYE